MDKGKRTSLIIQATGKNYGKKITGLLKPPEIKSGTQSGEKFHLKHDEVQGTGKCMQPI